MTAPQPAAPATTDPWRGFSDAWHRGFQEIFAIRLSRGADVGVQARTRVTTYVRWLGLAYMPVLINILLITLRAPASDRRTSTLTLLALLGTVNAGMFAAAVLAWGYAVGRAGTIDDLIRPCRDRDRIAAVIDKAVDFRRQIALPTLFAALPFIIALTAGREGLRTTPFPALVVINVAWSMFWLGNVSYWLLVAPLLLVRLRHSDQLALRWNDPARTPGVRTFAEGFTYPALFIALGAFAVTVPRLFDLELFGVFLPVIYGWLILLSLWVGVATQVNLYLIIRRYKLRVLDELCAARSFTVAEDETRIIPRRLRRTPSTLPTVLACYDTVAAAPILPYGTGLVVNYVAAVLGGIISILAK